MRMGRRAGDACPMQVRSSRVSFSGRKESRAGTQVRVHGVRELSSLHIERMFLIHPPRGISLVPPHIEDHAISTSFPEGVQNVGISLDACGALVGSPGIHCAILETNLPQPPPHGHVEPAFLASLTRHPPPSCRCTPASQALC